MSPSGGLEKVVLEKVGDYLDVKKPNKVVKVPKDDQLELRVAKRKADTVSKEKRQLKEDNWIRRIKYLGEEGDFEVVKIADVGDVVALVDGGTNVEELTPELTGGVELEDVGIQSIGMDLKLWRPAAVPCLTPVPEVGRHRCNATSGQDSNLIVTSVMDKEDLRFALLGFSCLLSGISVLSKE
ncbi:hypothetical protein ACFX14_010912 [Malus domestica]